MATIERKRWNHLKPRGAPPLWHVRELVDPREPALPRLVTCGPSPRPWLPLWHARNLLPGRSGEWFRALASDGLRPSESTAWLPGGPLEWHAAIALRNGRIAQIGAWAGSWPEWLLHEQPRPDSQNGRWSRRVVAIGEGGSVRSYPSVGSASRATGIPRRSLWRHLIDGSEIDGWTFCDAGTWTAGKSAHPE